MTAVEWLVQQLSKEWQLEDRDLHLIQQAKEMEKYNAKVEAKKYYLKGFEDAELTENQGCSHEQTMRDAETQFELVYPIKNNTMNKQTAVEWLFEQLYLSQGYGNTIEMLEQAKEMEKQQIIFHSVELCKLLLSNPIEKSGKQPSELIESYFKRNF
jgi:hypothetical protein